MERMDDTSFSMGRGRKGGRHRERESEREGERERGRERTARRPSFNAGA
jgi:hypothetical protein